MCYNHKQTKSITTLANRWQAKVEKPDLFNEKGIYNGFTYPHTPVITNTNPFLIKEYYWGLIPSWSKDDSIRAYTLNAKIETLLEKPSFKDCVNNRCLILIDGFYEWKWLDKVGKTKQKYLLTHKNDEAFALAGLYNDWLNKETGEVRRTYTIVTTEANELMAEIHNNKKRMPVSLLPEREDVWLEGANTDEFKKDSIDLLATAV
jgi:putative SOS response-associated peptidase YedK